MGTKYGNTPLSNFQIHRISGLESGYYYYEYIHAKGYKIIMRENETQTEYKYAEGNYIDRDTLAYDTYDKLA